MGPGHPSSIEGNAGSNPAPRPYRVRVRIREPLRGIPAAWNITLVMLFRPFDAVFLGVTLGALIGVDISRALIGHVKWVTV